MEQNFKNHVRVVPVFHLFVLPMLMVNFVWAAIRAVRFFNAGTVIYALTAAALVLAVLYGRVFALTVQNRVIRLEMRLRMQQLLPADLQPRINDFKLAQLIALRFASDAELPQLARKVLDENLTNQKEIKLLVRDWQGDFLRA
jgi:cell division protein FtsL